MYEIAETPFEVPVPGGTVRGVRVGPADSGRYPAIVFSHGLGSTHANGLAYARTLCPHGYVMYTFDFRGGSEGSLSGGATTDMSVLTELTELTCVMDAARAETNEVYLFGTSQGGLVAALYAARHPDNPRGLILLYPGLGIPDNVRGLFPGKVLPDSYLVMDFFPVGQPYALDIWDLDPYAEIGAYKGPVLLIHGDMDRIVPTDSSVRAADIYENAQLIVLPGAGHGFRGQALAAASDAILAFLTEARALAETNQV